MLRDEDIVIKINTMKSMDYILEIEVIYEIEHER